MRALDYSSVPQRGSLKRSSRLLRCVISSYIVFTYACCVFFGSFSDFFFTAGPESAVRSAECAGSEESRVFVHLFVLLSVLFISLSCEDVNSYIYIGEIDPALYYSVTDIQFGYWLSQAAESAAAASAEVSIS